MGVLSTLPARPLDDAEIERLRAREEVETLTVVGTTTIHERRHDRRAIVTYLVALVDGTVAALEYDDEWSREILETDADRRDHLDYALDRLETL